MTDLDDVLDALRAQVAEHDAPVATSAQVADRLDRERRRVLEDLRVLDRAGDVGSMKAGARARVWWPVRDDSGGCGYDDSAQVTVNDESHEDGPRATGTPRPTDDTAEGSGGVTAEYRDEAALADQSPHDVVEDALADFEAGRTRDEREARQASARAALGWLQQHGRPASRADFVAEAYPEHGLDSQGEDTWWRKVARPALKCAADHGFVETDSSGRKYRWTGRE
jgi:hypothetical protein